MVITEKEFRLKNGQLALLRSPLEEDADEMLHFIRKASGETEFLLKYPEEFDDYTHEKECGLLRGAGDDSDRAMIACFIDGKAAGNCMIAFHCGKKERHRANVAIAVLREYWGLGIGTRMFEEMIRMAQEREEIRQIELDFIEGNTRARCLYEKMGFRITGVKPDAVRLKDGTFLNEYMMMKMLRK